MSDIADFLRARYQEAKQREEGRRRIRFPNPFDGHDVEWRYSNEEPETLYIDGHPFPEDQYLKVATEPAPDPAAIADLDAKLAIVDRMERTLTAAEGDSEVDHYGALGAAEETLCLLAQPFAGHPDHKGKEWAP